MVSLEFSISISRRPHPPNDPPPYTQTHNRQNSHTYFKIEKLYTPTPTLFQKSTPRLKTSHPSHPPHISSIIKTHRRSLNCPALVPQHQHLESSSETTLLSPASRDQTEAFRRRKGRGVKMGDSSIDAVCVERRMSYGRGGAGNIRRQSDIPFSQKLNTDGTPRRRSSVFSSLGSSPEGSRKRRFSWFGIRKSSTAGEEDVKEEVEFRAVEMGGQE